MDFDDGFGDDPPQRAPPKASKFAPSSKFKPKPKSSNPGPKPGPEPPAAAAVKMEAVEEERAPRFPSNMEVDEPAKNGAVKEEPAEREAASSSGGGDAMEVEALAAAVAAEAEEEEEAVEDVVVAEYDVYFNPSSDPNSQLYVFQYPLRPKWRPYDLDQRCDEVRVKASTGEFEVDLSVDRVSTNYDHNAPTAEKFSKQTLSSKGPTPQATGYAVGVLRGKKLFLNPIRAVVQLRPSMDYLDAGGPKKKIGADVAVKQEGSSGPSRKQSKQMDPEVVEPWIPLKYYSSATELSVRYLQKMVREENNPIEFKMSPYDYLNSLCPGTASNKLQLRGPSRRSLLALPLKQRLKTRLVEGPPVQRFSAIKHLAPDVPVEDILEALQEYAHLVQGLWVVKTAIRHPNASQAEKLARNFALLLFSRNPVIRDSELDILGSHKSKGRTLIREIAVERQYCKDWKFKEPTDASFLKLFPHTVEEQRKRWLENEKVILEPLSQRRGGLNFKSITGAEKATKHGSSVYSGNSTMNSTARKMLMSRETREALPKILRKLFQNHKVCSFQTICQGLRDMAVSMSTLPKADARAAVAAAAGVDAPPEELHAAVSEVAVNVHGRYILKSSLEHPELNPLRNVVINLFLGSGPDAKLKKAEVIEAAKIKLQKEPTTIEFQKVISELCVSKGQAWVLKSGDGVPT